MSSAHNPNDKLHNIVVLIPTLKSKTSDYDGLLQHLIVIIHMEDE
jgi:hypothetical protein